MFFPLAAYASLLALTYFVSRRQSNMRHEALFFYLLTVGASLVTVFIALIPSQEFRSAFGVSVLVWSTILAAGAVTIGVLGYLNWPKPQYPLKEVRLSPSTELNIGLALYNLTVVTGKHSIRRLEVQVSYGYGVPTKWAYLDLREYTPEEWINGKEGKPKSHVRLSKNDQQTFTLVGLWSKESKGTFPISKATYPFFFKNIYWLDPSPEIYVKFIGVTEPKQKDYIVSFEENREGPSVDLFTKESTMGANCLTRRERIVGRKLSDMKITIWNRNEELGVMYAFVGDRNLLERAKRTGHLGVSEYPDRIKRRFPNRQNSSL
jgi:hypothetical protein